VGRNKRLSHVDAFLLDLDGTLYLGKKVFAYARRFLRELRRRGKGYVFLTNNSSRSVSAYVRKLRGMKIEATAEDIYTSGNATIDYITRCKLPKRIFLLGTPSLERQFERAGFELTDREPKMVVIGFDTTLTYERLDRVCRLVRSGLPYLATHPDRVCPIEEGQSIPDCGAIAAAIHAATGRRPLCLGKPSRYMARGALERLGVARRAAAMVGDRLYTDVRFGLQNGMTSILVLSGETTRSAVRTSRWKPDLVLPTVADILPLL